MRLSWLFVLCAILACGCARHKGIPRGSGAPSATGGLASTSTNTSLIVTPGTQVVGRVASVNPISRYVIATFPLGTMPALNQQFNVYRAGLKVAEIKITGPQRDVNIGADITAGECRIGDDIRTD